ncbi:MAG TPA: hypothetical protein VGM40_13480 [Mycobacterium sp.]
MASEFDGPCGEAMRNACPLRCGLRHGAAGDGVIDGQESACDWAGLPINLDFAFSQQQRDKVYAQHLMRRRGAQLWRWSHDGSPLCACENAGQERFYPSTAEPLSRG